MAAEKSSAYDGTAAAAAIVTARRRARGQRAEAEPDPEAPAAMRAWLKRAMGGAVRPATDLQDGGKVPAAESWEGSNPAASSVSTKSGAGGVGPPASSF
jgi:hypothetical protein